ncbi:MAG: hypothetical protein COB50_03325 [Thiotrichales bacterium]|nr:MAG: hypothetical protein COB50_03325 [Thiotrichales bacterium]
MSATKKEKKKESFTLYAATPYEVTPWFSEKAVASPKLIMGRCIIGGEIEPEDVVEVLEPHLNNEEDKEDVMTIAERFIEKGEHSGFGKGKDDVASKMLLNNKYTLDEIITLTGISSEKLVSMREALTLQQ